METYELLERELVAWSGRPHVVACSSGTSGLHLALESLRAVYGWRDGAEVIVPDLTMVACPRAVVLAGFTPVFVGCREDLTMEPALLEQAHSVRTVAVMPVHVYGRRVDMEAVSAFCRARGLCVVEDCAEFHGGRLHDLSDAWCWSFYKNKVVAGEEGGAVAFPHPEPARKARQLRSLGFTDAHDFAHVPRGHNYRMSNVHAWLVRESLRCVDGEVVRRRELESAFDSLCPGKWRMPPREVPWVYDLRIPWLGGAKQDEVVAAARKAGLAARHCFKPMHNLEEFQGCRYHPNPLLSTPRLSREVLYLPLSHETTPGKAAAAFEAITRTL